MTGEVRVSVEAVDHVHQLGKGMLVVDRNLVEEAHVDGEAIESRDDMRKEGGIHALCRVFLVLL